MTGPANPLGKPWTVALCGALAALAWQWFLVFGLYSGSWNGLFYTGSQVAVPGSIAAELPIRAPDPVGFDGQYYHVVAHDPLAAESPARFVDNPRLRWRRILVPGLAYGLALGGDRGVDAAFVSVVLAFTFIGVFWLAQLASASGASPWFGLAFVLLPATFISLERLTVDVALAALCVGFAVRLREGNGWRMWVLLALAPLARETGVALAGALVLVELFRGRIRAAVIPALALAPLAAWTLFIHSRTPADATVWFGSMPFGGLVTRTVNPLPDGAGSLGLALAGGLDYLAILGVWAAIVLIGLELRRRLDQPLVLASAMTLAIFAFLAKEDIWRHSYGFARTLSPALLMLGLAALRDRRPLLALPWALAAPRILYQALLLALSVAKAGA